MKLLVTSSVALVACAACAQTPIAALRDDLQKSRHGLPAFAAIYTESLRTPFGKKAETKGTTLSWGDHDSDVQIECAFGPHSASLSYIGDGKDPLWDTLAKRELCNEDGCFISVSQGSQGAISQRRPGDFNPAGAGYELRIGEPIEAIMAKSDAELAEKDFVRCRDAEYRFERSGDQVLLCGAETRSRTSQTMEVREWLDFKGSKFPKVVWIERRENGKPFQTITYSFVKLVDRPESLLRWPGWNEGALVKDNESNVVYKYIHGKLVVDPRFNKGLSARETLKRAIFVLAFLGFGTWFAFSARRWLLDRKAARSAGVPAQ